MLNEKDSWEHIQTKKRSFFEGCRKMPNKQKFIFILQQTQQTHQHLSSNNIQDEIHFQVPSSNIHDTCTRKWIENDFKSSMNYEYYSQIKEKENNTDTDGEQSYVLQSTLSYAKKPWEFILYEFSFVLYTVKYILHLFRVT